jgi:tetratricopeptide (TPR) repeat protein
MKKNLLTLILTVLVLSATAQNAKKLYKTGKAFLEDKRYKEAVEDLTKSLDMDKTYVPAIRARALAYERLNEVDKAILDLTEATRYDTKDNMNYYNMGRLYFGQKKYKDALKSLGKAAELNKKYEPGLVLLYKTQMQLRDFSNGLSTSEAALSCAKSADYYFFKAVALDSLSRQEDASYNYKRAITGNRGMEEAYVGLAMSKLKEGKNEEALKACQDLIESNSKSTSGYVARSLIYKKMGEFPKAVDDLSKVTAIDPTNMNAFFERGMLYQEFNQHGKAIIDFNKVIEKQDDNIVAYFRRAASLEANGEFKKAIKDYDKIRQLAPYDPVAASLLDKAKARMFELNREEDKPEVMLNAESKDGAIEAPLGQNALFVEGWVKDDSKIKTILIEGRNIVFNKDTLNPTFKGQINVKDKERVTITAVDVYDNKLEKVYAVRRTEVNKPIISLRAPVASDDGTIYLDNDDPTLYIEGVVKDESLIKSVVVEGANASFVIDQLNPTFSAKINIANKNKIKIQATDIYDNVTEKIYSFNKEGALISATNPMGKTWVIFIENSSYQNFASLDGPAKDVTMMKSEFANYEIHNLLHKKNLTKSQMEKFFSIELRDLVRANNVKSLMIWYAGHGKFVNETGYWIPINAKRDDEFTYFNINTLKASMNSYQKYLTHTLVVTDACESGPSFYQAMRGTEAERRCDDYTATQFKSSQVFSSAGYELASDNSQFTKTFAQSLRSNPDACMPIDKVVRNVSKAAAKGSTQKPKFGTIQGLTDENGTFFFIKKSK